VQVSNMILTFAVLNNFQTCLKKQPANDGIQNYSLFLRAKGIKSIISSLESSLLVPALLSRSGWGTIQC